VVYVSKDMGRKHRISEEDFVVQILKDRMPERALEVAKMLTDVGRMIILLLALFRRWPKLVKF
jgi:hypothetical protein